MSHKVLVLSSLVAALSAEVTPMPPGEFRGNPENVDQMGEMDMGVSINAGTPIAGWFPFMETSDSWDHL